MRFSRMALVASAVVLGACGGGDKSSTPTDSAITAAPTTNTAAPATGTVAKVPATGKTWEVKMIGDGTNYKFDPAAITIKQGDNVKFIVASGAPHNVAFDPAELAPAAKPQLTANMDNQMSELSGPMLLNTGDAYEISFGGVPPGTYTFHCTPHMAMNMKGTVTVK
jgi:plastocyanin